MTILEFFKTVHPSVLAAKMIFKHLQEHYPVVKISDIADTSSGGTPNRGMPEYYNGDIPWVKSGELKDGLITTCDEYITEAGLKNSSAKLFPKGTLLMAMYGANIGKTGVLDFDATTNQAVCAIFPKVDISRDFLFWYFKQQRIDFIAIGKGGAQPNISQTIINNASIVVPKPDVQSKIVKFLERIDKGEGIDYNFFIPEVLKDVETIYKYKNSYIDLSESFETQLTQLENLNQAILQEAVKGKLVPQDPKDEPASELLKCIKAEKAKSGKKEKPLPPIKPEEIPFEIPENWVWCRLGEICSKIGSGSTPKGSNYSKSGYPFFRSQNIYNDGLVYEDITFISKEVQKQMAGTIVLPNDILLNITGGSMGRCALVPNNFEEGNVSQHVCIIRPIQIDRAYFHKIVLAPYFQKFIFSSTTGAGREGLPKYNLEQFVVPLPPISEQKRIVVETEKQLAKTKRLKEHILANQQATEQLLKALLNNAFEREKHNKSQIDIPKFRTCSSSEKGILAGHILNQTNSEGLGRVKFQKILHLLEYHCQIDIGSNYVKKVAGPHDENLINEIETTLKKYRFFKIKKSDIGNHKVSYTALSAAPQLENMFKKSFSDEAERIDRFLSKFKAAAWDKCEIVSTLYAVWNNRLIKKEDITDELLKQDFLNWDPQKSKYINRLDGALNWMRENNIVPTGWGKYIDTAKI